MNSYKKVYQDWKNDPESFWMKAAEKIDWVRKPTKALNKENAPLYEWFTDGIVNTCYNAVDRHVENGRAIKDICSHGALPWVVYYQQYLYKC